MKNNKIKKKEKSPIEFFDDWAKKGKDVGMERGHKNSVTFMINKIKGNKPEGNLGIDMGCGNGWTVRKLKKELKYKQIIGIDGSPSMIKKAKKQDLEKNYICENIKNHQPEKKYDFIHSMEVLYYLEKPQKFIRKIYNSWIKKEGLFILGIDHYKENKPSINWPEECGVYMNTKSKEEWINIIKTGGFKNIKTWQVYPQKKGVGTLVIMGKKEG